MVGGATSMPTTAPFVDGDRVVWHRGNLTHVVNCDAMGSSSDGDEASHNRFPEYLKCSSSSRCFRFIRPPDIVVGGLGFYRNSFFLFVTCPPSSLNGTQPKLAICSKVSAIWKCMSEIWGWQVHWKLQGISYIVSKFHKPWFINALKLDRHFTHPPWILHSTSLPGFAVGDQQTELNKTLSNGVGKLR